MERMRSGAKRAASTFAEWIWPQRSIVSGARGGGDGAVSAVDWARLTFIEAPVCDRCGVPLGHSEAADICAPCTARPPRWSRARAALIYDEASRRPVLDLKRAGRRDGLRTMGAWMARAGKPLIAEADLIVPVPLHYRRLASRGFNQSGWLSAELSRQTDTPACQDALRRTRATPTQAGLASRARRRNVAGAFDVRASRQTKVAGKRIVLVDDVLTTGATLSACTRALRKAGAAQVDVLVLARVVRDEDVTI